MLKIWKKFFFVFFYVFFNPKNDNDILSFYQWAYFLFSFRTVMQKVFRIFAKISLLPNFY